MHVNRGLLGWGVFFIALGAVPLAVHAGVLDAEVASRAWELWPLVLVGIGLGLVLHRTRAAAVGGVMVALVFGLMAGGVVAGGWPTSGFAVCGSGGPQDASGSSGGNRTGTLGTAARVAVATDCGATTVGGQAGSDWAVAWDAEGQVPAVVATSSSLSVEAGNRHGFAIAGSDAHWTVTLPRDPDLRLDVSVNAGSTTADLAGLHLPSLDASVNAGEARLDLSGAQSTTSVSASVNLGSMSLRLPTPSDTLAGSMSVNLGSLEVCVPAGVPLRIRTADSPLGADNFADRGMTRQGSTWTRGAFDTSTARIDLSVSVNLGSITLDPEDGCG
jgi:hypothetical protein